MKVRPAEEEFQAIGPDFIAEWKAFFSLAPDNPVLLPVPLHCLSVLAFRFLALLPLTVMHDAPDTLGPLLNFRAPCSSPWTSF